MAPLTTGDRNGLQWQSHLSNGVPRLVVGQDGYFCITTGLWSDSETYGHFHTYYPFDIGKKSVQYWRAIGYICSFQNLPVWAFVHLTCKSVCIWAWVGFLR